MVVREIMDTLRAMCVAYSQQEWDYVKWVSLPLLVVENSDTYPVSELAAVSKLFEGIRQCHEDLNLPTIDFNLQHLHVISDKIVAIKITWGFFNVRKKTEVSLEAGHIFQKKEDGWKIIAILQPLWRDPMKTRSDIKKL